MTEYDLIGAGTVEEIDSDKSLVKVNMLGRITDWLPLLQQANSFKRKFVSVRKGQQVVVLANRYVIGSIFNVDCKEPDGANDHIDITDYEDGTRIEYDTESKTLKVNCVGDINVECVNAVVKAKTVNVDSQDIKLNGGKGVVTGNHICMFTGNPHADCSTTVTAGK